MKGCRGSTEGGQHSSQAPAQSPPATLPSAWLHAVLAVQLCPLQAAHTSAQDHHTATAAGTISSFSNCTFMTKHGLVFLMAIFIKLFLAYLLVQNGQINTHKNNLIFLPRVPLALPFTLCTFSSSKKGK